MRIIAFLFKFINSDAFLEKIESNELEYEKILLERESDPFDTDWMNSFEAVEALGLDVSSEMKEKINQIRKQSYLRCYGITKNADLSGYVSDDFELICNGGDCNSWVRGLFEIYLSGAIPSGKVENSRKNLEELLL